MFQVPASTVERQTLGRTSLRSEDQLKVRGQSSPGDSPEVRFTAEMFQAVESTVRRETPGETRR